MKIEIILGRIFIVIVSSMIGFLLADYISTYFITTGSPIEGRFPVGLMRHPKPYVMFGGKPGAFLGNSLGYREKKDATLPKNDNEFRIFMLGGSTVFEGDPPIPALLEEEFSHNNLPNVKVYNFGVVSSVSGMELARIVFEVCDLEPDLVIFYNGGNDVFQPFQWDPRPGYPYNFIAYENNPLLQYSDVKKYPTLAMLAYGSNIARYLFYSYFVDKFVPLSQVREEIGWNTREWREKIADIYIRNLIKADKISKICGANFIAFFQPMLYSKITLAPEEKELIKHLENYIEEKAHVLETQELIRQKIVEIKRTNSINIIDISSFYDNNPAWVFGDRIHTEQPAKILIAKEIYKHIINIISFKKEK